LNVVPMIAWRLLRWQSLYHNLYRMFGILSLRIRQHESMLRSVNCRLGLLFFYQRSFRFWQRRPSFGRGRPSWCSPVRRVTTDEH
jgi:hypothetical protein